MAVSSFAISYTVKNEARLLPQAISYHFGAGCSKIYVFFDGTTDNTRELIAHYDGLVILDTIMPEDVELLPNWVRRIIPRWKENMDVRKRINTYKAVQQAAADGIEWLICIDPDELIVPSLHETIAVDTIPRFLQGIPDDIDQVLLRNLEVLPTSDRSNDPFRELTLFFNRFPFTDVAWRYSRAAFRLMVLSPKLRAWYDFAFFNVRFFGSANRLMRHPVTGESIPATYFLGYLGSKAFIRVRTANKFNFNIHEWVKEAEAPKNLTKGFILHYHLFDAADMLAKFRQRNKALLVSAFYVLHTLANIARDLSDELVVRFFVENVTINDQNRILLLVRKNVLVRVTSVSDFFSSRLASNN
jgi:hypothetical protein